MQKAAADHIQTSDITGKQAKAAIVVIPNNT